MLSDRHLNFDKLFLAAEIAKFKPEERQAYEESLKHYRDLKNVIDTSFLEGEEAGFSKGKEEGARAKALEIARSLKAKGLLSKEIAELTGLSLNDLEEV